MQNAPNISDYYSKIAKQDFDQLQSYLTYNNIDYKVVPTLVRGLDYYKFTVFEFTTDQLGSQSAVFAGGRYYLSKSYFSDQQDFGAVGCAGGVERISLLLHESSILINKKITLVLILLKLDYSNKACEIHNHLSKIDNLSVCVEYNKKVKHSLRRFYVY